MGFSIINLSTHTYANGSSIKDWLTPAPVMMFILLIEEGLLASVMMFILLIEEGLGVGVGLGLGLGLIYMYSQVEVLGIILILMIQELTSYLII